MEGFYQHPQGLQEMCDKILILLGWFMEAFIKETDA